MQKFKYNLIANIVGKIWSFVSIFLFVPFYIKFLSFEEYGIINFYTVILSFVLILDSGFSSVINREMSKENSIETKGSFLKTIQSLYFIVFVGIILAFYFFSHYLAQNFLQTNSIDLKRLGFIVFLMGISISFNLLILFYNNVLLGLELQVKSNFYIIIWNFAKFALVIIPLYLYKNLETYFFWQIFINVIFFIIFYIISWNQFKIKSSINFKLLINIRSFFLGILFLSLVSTFNLQLDKLMVGKILELKEYSFFSIASMFSQISIFFATPIIITILPKLIKASEANDFQEKRKLFINFALFIHIISIIICMICIFYADNIIALWIDQTTSLYISSFVKFHIIGSLLMTFQFVPFYLPIAMGHSQINAVSSFVSMIVYTCSLYIFIHKFMLIGASISWIILNSMGFLYSFYLIFRYLNYSVFKEWLIQLIIIPLVIAIFSFLPIYLLSNCVNFQFDYMFILNILISSILFIIGIIFYVKNKFPKIYSIVVLNLKISIK